MCPLFTKKSVIALGLARELTRALTLPTLTPFPSRRIRLLTSVVIVLVLLWYVERDTTYPFEQLVLLRMRVTTAPVTLETVCPPA